jgi:cobalt-zinc-cadmium efflux system protein
LTLILVAVYLIIEAIKRFHQPHEINSKWVIILSLLAIFINGFSAIILQRDAKNNLNIRSAYLHLLSDTLTSFAVLTGGIIMLYYHVYWIDGFLTLAIAIYLVFVTWKLFMESLKVLMLFTPSGVIPEKINDRLCKITGVQNIHHIHIWQLDNDQIHFEGHIDLINDIRLSEVNEVMEEIRKILHTEFNIDHVTLQPELNNCESKDLVSQRH